MQILAADIGGTRARLMLAEVVDGGFVELRRQVLASADFAGLPDLLAAFLQPGDAPQLACVAVAGPVSGQRARMTNLPWQLDAGELAGCHGIARVHLLNDFAAQAHGLPLLQRDELCVLQAGTSQSDGQQPGGLRALLGAGTGLGMALLTGDTPAQVLPSEGGHAGFAPQDAEQLALCQHLLQRHARVSVEMLLSGAGLQNIFGFVAGRSDTPAPAAITAAALAGDSTAVACLQLFSRIYLSAAANLGLTVLASGGVYLGGGIAPRILPFLQQQAGLFSDKPPMTALLQGMPLQVVLDEFLGLRGAALLASRLVRESAHE